MASSRKSISGRQSEQALLKQLFRGGKAQFLAIYGRRRVGKTFLVRHFFHHSAQDMA